MSSSLEYRDRERQRKRESRRQASQAQRVREQQRARERRRNCSDEQREREQERNRERRRNPLQLSFFFGRPRWGFLISQPSSVAFCFSSCLFFWKKAITCKTRTRFAPRISRECFWLDVIWQPDIARSAYQIRGDFDKTMASLQAFLSFPPRAPHTLSRAPKFPLPLPLSTPATQANFSATGEGARKKQRKEAQLYWRATGEGERKKRRKKAQFYWRATGERARTKQGKEAQFYWRATGEGARKKHRKKAQFYWRATGERERKKQRTEAQFHWRATGERARKKQRKEAKFHWRATG